MSSPPSWNWTDLDRLEATRQRRIRYSDAKLNLPQIDKIFSEILNRIEESLSDDLNEELQIIYKYNESKETQIQKYEGTLK